MNTSRILKSTDLAFNLSAESSEPEQLYLPILHNAPTNKLASMSNAPITQRDSITQESMVESGACKLFIEKYTELLAPRCSVFKLFDMCCIELARINDYRSKQGAINKDVQIPLEEYMRLCGLDYKSKTARDKARRRVHEDLNSLYRFSLEWKDPKGGKYADFHKERICQAARYEQGNIRFIFTDNLANALNSSFIGQYPTSIFKLDDRSRNTYPLARKIAMHACNDYNREKGTAYILSVETLLASCPDIPSYEKVGEKSRAFTQKIREPLEKALDALSDFASWEYCNSKGSPLTDAQLASNSWSTYKELLVRFTFKEEPDQKDRLKRKAERARQKPRARKKPAQ